MSSNRWQRITELFQAALELSPSQRGAFLDEACGQDRQLRKEVGSLLEADREAGDFMEDPAVVAQDVPDVPGSN